MNWKYDVIYVNFLSVVLRERNVIIIYTPNQTHRLWDRGRSGLIQFLLMIRSWDSSYRFPWLRPFNHFVTPKKLSFHFSHFLFLTHFTLSLCVGKSTESGEEEDVFLKQLWNVKKINMVSCRKWFNNHCSSKGIVFRTMQFHKISKYLHILGLLFHIT